MFSLGSRGENPQEKGYTMTRWCDKCQEMEPTIKAIYTETSEGSQWRLEEWVQYLCDECYDDLTERVREGNIFSLIGHELTH